MQTLRSLVLVACSLALVLPSTASQVGEAATEPCCRASDNPSQDTVCISAREMKSRITVVQALKPPCCSQHFDKSGIVYPTRLHSRRESFGLPNSERGALWKCGPICRSSKLDVSRFRGHS
jgi:hypothetical protein